MQSFSVVIFILPDGRLVLQRRTKDAPYAPGELGSFGGKIETDETPEACAHREISEETSLDVNSLQFHRIFDVILPKSNDYAIDRHFYIFTVAIQDTTFTVYEGERAEAFSLTELQLRQDLTVGMRRILEYIQQASIQLIKNHTT